MSGKKPMIHKGERFFDAFRVMVEGGEIPDPSLSQWELMIAWVDGLAGLIKDKNDEIIEIKDSIKDQVAALKESYESERNAYRVAKKAIAKKEMADEASSFGIALDKLRSGGDVERPKKTKRLYNI